MRCIEIVGLLLLSIPVSQAAYCGTSTIPYSFEVLPDGSTVLGCARPTSSGCFGYDPMTGEVSSRDESFMTIENNPQANGQRDGFLRTGNDERVQPFLLQNPQTAICMSAPLSGCMQDQWSGGIYHLPNGGLSLTCCQWPPLFTSEDRGIATIHPGEIFIGGEIGENGGFDYIQNVTEFYDAQGRRVYDVRVRRFGCPTPQALPPQQAFIPQQAVQQVVQQPQVYQPQQSYYYPAVPAMPNYLCFSADSTVTLQSGEVRRMDEIKMDQTEWVKSSSNDINHWHYAPLLNWIHREPEILAEFVVLTTASGNTIKLTDKHFIHRVSCNSTMKNRKSEMVTADEIILGDCLMKELERSQSLIPTEVISIDRVTQKGIFAPITDQGNIIVDGIAASCLSEAKENFVLRGLLPVFSTCISTDGSLTCSFQQSTVNLLLDMMKLAVPNSSFL